jgi:hypothetical protein
VNKASFYTAIVLMIVAMIPCWLYASGNMPAVFPADKNVTRAVFGSFPRVAGTTYGVSHCLFETMRQAGFYVPPTYNERIVKMRIIRRQVHEICEEILVDAQGRNA